MDAAGKADCTELVKALDQVFFLLCCLSVLCVVCLSVCSFSFKNNWIHSSPHYTHTTKEQNSPSISFSLFSFFVCFQICFFFFLFSSPLLMLLLSPCVHTGASSRAGGQAADRGFGQHQHQYHRCRRRHRRRLCLRWRCHVRFFPSSSFFFLVRYFVSFLLFIISSSLIVLFLLGFVFSFLVFHFIFIQFYSFLPTQTHTTHTHTHQQTHKQS